MKALFDNYTTEQDYVNAGVRPVEPMTAKEYLNDEELSLMLSSSDFIAEEKLDGTRATMHIGKDYSRIFSRRISKKTNWYAENSDSVPHLRGIKSSILDDTVIDGEMLIDGRPFKDVSSTLNCTWDKAVERQKELGKITFHAFDIIYYKGVYIAKMPLIKRKSLLRKVVDTLNNEYVTFQAYFDDTITVTIEEPTLKVIRSKKEAYSNLYNTLKKQCKENSKEDFRYITEITATLNKLETYEYILASGGEGLMLKDKEGTYKHTRGREYTKLKKFETWDCVIVDFVDPTVIYTGKESKNPNAKWDYWCDIEDNSIVLEQTMTMSEAEYKGYFPCTKFHCKGWIGTVKFGVTITNSALRKWKKLNPKEKEEIYTIDNIDYLVVGETSGFDDATRQVISKNNETFLGKVIELKGQEVLKTGKLRHPRFLRWRTDKENVECNLESHMRW